MIKFQIKQVIEKQLLIQRKSLHLSVFLLHSNSTMIINNPHKQLKIRFLKFSYRILHRCCRSRSSSRLSRWNLDITTHFLGAFNLIIGEITVSSGAEFMTSGEDGPDKVHGGGGKSTATNAEE